MDASDDESWEMLGSFDSERYINAPEDVLRDLVAAHVLPPMLLTQMALAEQAGNLAKLQLQITLKNGARRTRAANIDRGADRTHALDFIQRFSDDMFKRQYRLSREDFEALVTKIKDTKPGYDEARHRMMAVRSSKSWVPIYLKLAVTMRYLAGASYLDMIWYGVPPHMVTSLVRKMLVDLDRALDNISLPSDEEGWQKLSRNWAIKRMVKHNGIATNMGTVLAIDGFVLEIRQPTTKELRGRDVNDFFNRKGFYGLLAQVACDANGKIRFVDMSWPGATNDITAIRQTSLYKMFVEHRVPV
jgi:hypothetical protein